MDCCNTGIQKKHLIIIGGGSAAFSATIKANELGAAVTMINAGLPIGGTCVNVGCIPSKALIRAAEQVHHSNNHEFRGIQTSGHVADFKALMDQKQELVQELRQAKYVDVVSDMEDFTLMEGHASFKDASTVSVNGQNIHGDAVLIATGATTFVPIIPGLRESGFLTNETLFELDTLPDSLIVLGGRYVALEVAQMFARFGTRVTVLQRSSRILPTETLDITDTLTAFLENEGIEIVTGVSLISVLRDGYRVSIQAEENGKQREFTAGQLLLATGRKPNTDGLGLSSIGVETDAIGAVQVDESLSTGVPGVFAAGDVIGKRMFVYTAAAEGALAAKNALTGSETPLDASLLPWVIFTDPQLAGVGMDEEEAVAAGLTPDVSILPMSHVPRALAARDTRG
ncbi:MAG: mercury(II) reductase, partial [Acidobacteria bacterium]